MMVRILGVSALVFGSILASSPCWAQTATQDVMPSAATRLGQAFWADSQAHDLLRQITTTSRHRMAATPEGAAAEAFVFEKLKSFGFDDVEYQTVPITSWIRGTLTFEAAGRQIQAAALGYSPAQIDIRGDLVDMGNGVPADYATNSERVRGKIALVYLGKLPGSPADTPSMHRIEKTALAIQQGAIGIIFINTTTGNFLTTGTANDALAPDRGIAAAVVGNDDGMALKQQAAAGIVPVHLKMQNDIHPGAGRNIIATIRGSSLPDEDIVLGGHLDSWDLSSGAFDNGVGSMWILDVARGLKAAGYQPRRTIKIIFFTGEELGLLGSLAYVNAAREDGTLSRVKYMINTDMVLNPTGFYVWGGSPDMAFFNDLARTVHAVVPGFTDGASTGNARGVRHSDSQPFIESGIPVVYPKPTWPQDMLKCVHSDCDNFANVPAEGMKQSATVGAMLVAALADATVLPATIMTPEQVDQYFTSEGLVMGLNGRSGPLFPSSATRR